VADVPSGLSLTSPRETKKERKKERKKKLNEMIQSGQVSTVPVLHEV
jgi:hypothetical protein